LKHAAALPPHSAIFWHLMNVDAAGVVHEGDTGLPRLYEVANAPIFTFDDSFFGREIVGGPMHSVLSLSRDTVAVVVRILGGEKAGDIKIAARGYAPPIFDWRQLQRWGISERNLPPGSEIRFRQSTAWEQYRWQIMLVAAALLLQTGLIMGLFHEHRRRRAAELEARRRISELAHMNRRAVAGEMSASIAHEVNQPLAAIVTNANIGLRWLAKPVPDLGEMKEVLTHIVNDGHRASETVGSIRAMFKSDEQARAPVDVNALIHDILLLTRAQADDQRVRFHTQLMERLPHIAGNRVQLQQVILNLVMNGIEAISSVTDRPRELRISSAMHNPFGVVVAIADSGTGIDPQNSDRIFDAFFTTKSNGMGMGLSICRSIVEAHRGRLSVSRAHPHGSVFQVFLPLFETGPHERRSEP